jgi:hypothetical protein
MASIPSGEALGNPVVCDVSRETLADYFDANNLDKTGRLEAFAGSRKMLE